MTDLRYLLRTCSSLGIGSYERGAVVLDRIKRIGLDKTNRIDSVAYREI